MTGTQGTSTKLARLHPLPLRIMHWLNAIAILVMIGSGWRIYNNDPIFGFIEFPITFTFGGDPDITYRHNGDAGFSNALLWHFAFMWLLVANGLAYVIYGVATGRFRRMLLPVTPRDVVHTIRETLRLHLAHDDITMYNAVQKLMYIGVLCVLVLVVISGVTIWKPVQFSALAALFGGFQGARLVHFCCMGLITAFLVVHVMLAILVPRTIAAMITGGPPNPRLDGRPSLPAE